MRAARLLGARLSGGHLERIVQRDSVTLELLFSGPRGEASGAAPTGRARCALVVSADPRHARVGETERFAPAPPAPLGFAQLLRAHVERARVTRVCAVDGERQIEISLGSGASTRRLVLQILGPRSNVYLLGAEGEILGTLRPLAETRRDLAPGAALGAPATTPPADGGDRFASSAEADFLRAVEAHYAGVEREARAELLARRIGRALARERGRLLRRETALRGDLAKQRSSETLRREGELLKGALREIPPGAEQVRIRDWESGQEVEIPLDPALSAARNLEKRFASYQRARRREEETASQLAAIEALRTVLARLDAAFGELAGAEEPDAEALAQLATRPEVERLLARHRLAGDGRRRRIHPARESQHALRASHGKRPGEAPAQLRPGRYRTSDGLEVWVGRSAQANDYLTTRLARGSDLFFHVEASPGSHVVLRTAGRRDVPQESLLEAAELAVHFSKQRHAARATLHVAPIKDVRKPSGARPGLVHVQRGRTLALRRDASRLARVLGARIDPPE